MEDRTVTKEEGEQLATEKGIFFLETSAKDNSDQMIENVFVTLSTDIVQRQDQEDEDEFFKAENTQKLELGKSNQTSKGKKKKKCC